jgi:hypothetical protein
MPNIFTGAAAKAELSSCISRAFDDDATGGVFGYGRNPGYARVGAGGPGLQQIHDAQDPRLADDTFEMIVVDSGNSSGDAWKYVHHVGACSGMFVDETR